MFPLFPSVLMSIYFNSSRNTLGKISFKIWNSFRFQTWRKVECPKPCEYFFSEEMSIGLISANSFPYKLSCFSFILPLQNIIAVKGVKQFALQELVGVKSKELFWIYGNKIIYDVVRNTVPRLLSFPKMLLNFRIPETVRCCPIGGWSFI